MHTPSNPFVRPSILRHAPVCLAAALVLGLGAACGSSSDGKGGEQKAEAAPPPAQPSNGAPIAFEVVKATPGAKFEGKIAIKGYNFSDKKLAQYSVAARFTDASGAPLKVGVGTPFEDTVVWTSLSGNKYACAPKSWCEAEITGVEVPADAAKTEVALTSARALAADGTTIEDKDTWASKDGMGKWPSDLE
jgi:hypothetical protein